MTAEELTKQTLERLRRVTEKLEAGESLPVTIVRREETPDGPLHTFDKQHLTGEELCDLQDEEAGD